MSRFDYIYLLDKIEEKGKILYGKAYAIDDIDRPVMTKLIAYFLQDEEVAEKENLDLKKGLLLTGPIGCGKTALMRIMSHLCLPDHRPYLKSAIDVNLEFGELGSDVILKYSKRAFNPYRKIPVSYCFDDVGQEAIVNFWGNKINLIGQILFTRYNLMHSHGMVTHVITKLNATELETVYGDQMRSRMREMFNLIAFQPESRDKRR